MSRWCCGQFSDLPLTILLPSPHQPCPIPSAVPAASRRSNLCESCRRLAPSSISPCPCKGTFCSWQQRAISRRWQEPASGNGPIHQLICTPCVAEKALVQSAGNLFRSAQLIGLPHPLLYPPLASPLCRPSYGFTTSLDIHTSLTTKQSPCCSAPRSSPPRKHPATHQAPLHTSRQIQTRDPFRQFRPARYPYLRITTS